MTLGGQTFGAETTTGVLAGPAAHHTVAPVGRRLRRHRARGQRDDAHDPRRVAPVSAISGAMDLAAYLERIGVGAGAGLAELHRAHVTSIPFENLDSHRGVPVSLELADLERKLVDERRGGYCFEHNLLFAAALEALGLRGRADARPRSPGPAAGDPAPAHPPRASRPRRATGVWLADVGFGNGTLLEPIPFGPGAEHEQSGWRFRIVQDGAEHVLQNADGLRVGRRLRLRARAGPVRRHRDEQLVHLHPPGLAVRGRADRRRQPPRRHPRGAQRLERALARHAHAR